MSAPHRSPVTSSPTTSQPETEAWCRPTLLTVQGIYLMLDGTHDNTPSQFAAATG